MSLTVTKSTRIGRTQYSIPFAVTTTADASVTVNGVTAAYTIITDDLINLTVAPTVDGQAIVITKLTPDVSSSGAGTSAVVAYNARP
jgi:hypothetical protein